MSPEYQQILVTGRLKENFPWDALVEAARSFNGSEPLLQAIEGRELSNNSGRVWVPASTARAVNDIWRLEREAGRASPSVADGWSHFLEANRVAKEVISVAQIEEMSSLDAASNLLPAVSGLLSSINDFVDIPRLLSYSARFNISLRNLRSEPEYLASPFCDSLHTILFELHEDLRQIIGQP